LTTEELLEWSNCRLGQTQRLGSLQFVDELPRSAIGKVLKRTPRDGFEAWGAAPYLPN